MNKNFTANRVFTDRESYKKSLSDSLHRLVNGGKKELLVIYGVGGQGKSSICWEFKNGSLIRHGDVVHSLTDFDSKREMPEILENVRKDLGKQLHMKFTAFDLTFLKYKTLLSNSEFVRSKYNYMYKFENETANDIIDITNECLSEVPGLRVIFNRIKGLGQKYYDSRLKKSVEFLEHIDFDNLGSSELERLLPKAFAHDLNRILKKESLESKRVVILFDTYEQLWQDKNNRQGAGAASVDQWFRDLFEEIQGKVLFIVFGRDKLKWTELDEKYDEIISQHRLDRLSAEDCNSFLRKVPIEEPAIRTKIIKSSEGLPHYLDLQVNIYEDLKNEQKPISLNSFGDNPKEIHIRFVKHIGDEAERRLRYAAIPRSFSKEIFKYLRKERYFDRTLDFDAIVSETYFENLHNDDEYIIHSLLRDHLLTDFEKKAHDDFLEISQVMADFYQSKFDDLFEVKSFNEELESHAKELFYHLLIADQKEVLSLVSKMFNSDLVDRSLNLELVSDFCNTLSNAYEGQYKEIQIIDYYRIFIASLNGNFKRVLEIYNKTFKGTVEKMGTEDENLIKEVSYPTIININAGALIDDGQYRAALFFIQENRDRCQFGVTLSDLYSRLGKKGLAISFVYNELNELNGIEETLNELKGTYFNRLGNYFSSVRLLESAFEAYEESLERYPKDHPLYSAVVISKLALAKLDLNDDSGIGACKEALRVMENNKLANHPIRSKIELSMLKHEIRKNGLEKFFGKDYNSHLKLLEDSLLDRFEDSQTHEFVLQFIKGLGKEKSACLRNYINLIRHQFGDYHYSLMPFLELADELNEDLGFPLKSRIKDIRSFAEYSIRTKGLIKISPENEAYTQVRTLLDDLVIGINTNECTAVEIYELPFWKENAYLVKISYHQFSNYCLIKGEKYYFPDGSNRAFYQLSGDHFELSPENITLYVRLFLDFTMGRHGRFIIAEELEDLSWSSNYDGGELPPELLNQLKPLEIIHKTEELIKLKCQCMIFKNSVFTFDVKVDSHGVVSLENEEEKYTSLPFRYEYDVPERDSNLSIGFLEKIDTSFIHENFQREVVVLKNLTVSASTISLKKLVNHEYNLVQQTKFGSKSANVYKLDFYIGDMYLVELFDQGGNAPNYMIQLENGKTYPLDGSNSTFCALNNKLIFNEESCRKYARFFFTANSGRHGHFVILDDISSKFVNYESEQCLNELEPMLLLETQEQTMRFRCSHIIFKNSVFSADIEVHRNGQISISNEKQRSHDVIVTDDDREKVIIEFTRKLNRIKLLAKNAIEKRTSNDIITPLLVIQATDSLKELTDSI